MKKVFIVEELFMRCVEMVRWRWNLSEKWNEEVKVCLFLFVLLRI